MSREAGGRTGRFLGGCCFSLPVALTRDAQDSLSCLFGSKSKTDQTNQITKQTGLRSSFLGERAYLDLIKTGFDWALPPPATIMTNDIPAFASGTVASMAESLMNLKATGVFEAALKVTV